LNKFIHPSEAILVCGGAGFLGSCFVRQTIGPDKPLVIVLDALTYAGNRDSIPFENLARFHFVKGDINDTALVLSLLKKFRVTSVVNFAAETHVDRSIDSPIPFLRSNVQGTCSLLEAALEYYQTEKKTASSFRFLQISTDEVYGSAPSEISFTETSPLAPSSPYAASKAAADHFVLSYHRTYNLPTLIVRCCNNYGPFQFPEKFIPLLIQRALRNQTFPLYGDGQHQREWIHVEDTAKAIQSIGSTGRIGEIYHVSSRESFRNIDVAQMILNELRSTLDTPVSSQIEFVADRPGHDRRYSISIEKTIQETDWRYEVPFVDGLRRTIRWYLDHRDWVDRVTSGTYRGERLGSAARFRS
jgi:dTDP-glucose 4,6-dehydratase